MLNEESVERVLKWDRRFLRLATEVATWSKDPSTKVGAVIVRADRSVAAVGYNGFPSGQDDDPSKYADRAYKYNHILHAEDNAIRRCSEADCSGSTMYTSFPACPECVRKISDRHFLRVVCPPLPIEGRPPDWVQQWTVWVAESLFIAKAKGVSMVLRSL